MLSTVVGRITEDMDHDTLNDKGWAYEQIKGSCGEGTLGHPDGPNIITRSSYVKREAGE